MLLSVLNRPFSWFAIAVWAFAFDASAQTAQNQSVNLTIPQARKVAVKALQDRQPQLALQIAYGLLQRDSNDPFAYFIIAKASQQAGNPREGRRAAARAFRYTKTDQDKFTASQLAARLSYEEKRFTLAQIWLRRSVNFAPTPQHRQQLIKDFRRLRMENPWNTHLQFSIVPSSNINSGSDDTLLTVDGVPIVGVLSRDAQALAGVLFIANISTTYRLTANKKRALYLTGRFYSRQVSLSSEAKREVPGIQSKDFGSTIAEVGLRYSITTGEKIGVLILNSELGKYWYGGNPNYTFARIGAAQGIRISKESKLTFSGTYEYQNPEIDSNPSTKIAGLRGRFSHILPTGSTIGFGLSTRKTSSQKVNTASTSTTAYVSYAMAKPIGPARMSFELGAAYKDYPVYFVGFGVPGGRQDTTVFASAHFAFEKIDYAGFMPVLSLRAQKNRSNISRFDTTQLSVSIGIKSSF